MREKIAFVIPTLRDGGAERVLSNMSINLDDNIDQRILVWDANDIDYPYKGELVDLDLPYSSNLIIKLNLFNVTRKEHITIEQLINNLKYININTSTHELIDLNSIDDNKTVIIYRFD